MNVYFRRLFFYLCGNIIFVINISLVCLSFLWHFSTNSTIHSKGKRFLLRKSQRYIQHEKFRRKNAFDTLFFLHFITSARASNIELGASKFENQVRKRFKRTEVVSKGNFFSEDIMPPLLMSLVKISKFQNESFLPNMTS